MKYLEYNHKINLIISVILFSLIYILGYVYKVKLNVDFTAFNNPYIMFPYFVTGLVSVLYINISCILKQSTTIKIISVLFFGVVFTISLFEAFIIIVFIIYDIYVLLKK